MWYTLCVRNLQKYKKNHTVVKQSKCSHCSDVLQVLVVFVQEQNILCVIGLLKLLNMTLDFEYLKKLIPKGIWNKWFGEIFSQHAYIQLDKIIYSGINNANSVQALWCPSLFCLHLQLTWTKGLNLNNMVTLLDLIVFCNYMR